MTKLSRKPANRNHLVRNLVTSLLLYEKVITTKAKSKLLKQEVDKLINRAKKMKINDRKYVMGYLFDKKAYKKMYEVIIPQLKDTSSGYTKTYKLGERRGDNSEMVLIKLTKINKRENEQ